MKLNPNFLRHTMDNQELVVPVAGADFHGMIRGNRSVSAILDLLAEDTTEEAIVDTMCERFDGDRDVIGRDVADVLSRLKEVGAIIE